ncbi:MAG: VacJ family lipoprotein [Candidatus Scalindua sp.]|nr:VacJ family lipoprotein [Candidatus Scalindua sp.]
MRKLVLLMCFFVLTMYTFNISLFAEDTTASREQPAVSEQPVVSESDDKSPVVVDTSDTGTDEYDDLDFLDVSVDETFVKDSVPRYNRAVFTFNDKLYYYFFRPLSKGWGVVPEFARSGVRNFFTNVRMPGRFFNCLFQGKFNGAGTELKRFVINSTIGGAGFSDPAKKHFNLELQDEDFGQTLGYYDMDAGTHLQLPFFGPSNVRDTFGLVVDMALDPVTLLMFVNPYASPATRAFIAINEISIDKGDTYEGLVEQAIDPYIAVQDAYTQNRAKKLKE